MDISQADHVVEANEMAETQKEIRYQKIRKIFRRHYPCAFNELARGDGLDCLVYMAWDIEKVFQEALLSDRASREDEYQKLTGDIIWILRHHTDYEVSISLHNGYGGMVSGSISKKGKHVWSTNGVNLIKRLRHIYEKLQQLVVKPTEPI